MVNETLAWKSDVGVMEDDDDENPRASIAKESRVGLSEDYHQCGGFKISRSADQSVVWKSTVGTVYATHQREKNDNFKTKYGETTTWKSTDGLFNCYNEEKHVRMASALPDKTIAWSSTLNYDNCASGNREVIDENMDEDDFLAKWAKLNRCETVVRMPSPQTLSKQRPGNRSWFETAKNETVTSGLGLEMSNENSHFSIPSSYEKSNRSIDLMTGSAFEEEHRGDADFTSQWQPCPTSKTDDDVFRYSDGPKVLDAPVGWVCKVHNGETFYVNAKSGIVVSNIESCYKRFALSHGNPGASVRADRIIRHSGLLPSGKSPFSHAEINAHMIPTNPDLDQLDCEVETVGRNKSSTVAALREWENPTLKFQPNVSNVNSAAKYD